MHCITLSRPALLMAARSRSLTLARTGRKCSIDCARGQKLIFLAFEEKWRCLHSRTSISSLAIWDWHLGLDWGQAMEILYCRGPASAFWQSSSNSPYLQNNKSIVSRSLVILNSYFRVERNSWYPDIATMMLYNAEWVNGQHWPIRPGLGLLAIIEL